MGTHGDSLLMMTSWVLGTFAMALATLFSLLGIFILGALLIPLLPIVAIVMLVVFLLRGETSQAAPEEPVAVKTRAVEEAEEILTNARRKEAAAAVRG